MYTARASLGVLFALATACATAIVPPDEDIDAGTSPTDASTSPKDTYAPPPPDGGPSPDAFVPPKDAGGGGKCSFSGVLATWDFTGETGSQVSTTAKSSAQGVTAGSVSRAAALKAVTGTNSINSSQWSTSVNVGLTTYLSLTITPPSGCTMDLTSATIDSKSSALGPSAAAVATSTDKYASMSTFKPAGAPTQVSMSVSGASGAVEVRIYGYGAVDVSGTMRVQNTLTISGALH